LLSELQADAEGGGDLALGVLGVLFQQAQDAKVGVLVDVWILLAISVLMDFKVGQPVSDGSLHTRCGEFV
jgi:hypothetical protein